MRNERRYTKRLRSEGEILLLSRPLPTEATLDFGRKLRGARVRRGLNQYELAERMMLSQGYISMIEAGKRNPSLIRCEELAAAVGCRYRSLLEL